MYISSSSLNNYYELWIYNLRVKPKKRAIYAECESFHIVQTITFTASFVGIIYIYDIWWIIVTNYVYELYFSFCDIIFKQIRPLPPPTNHNTPIVFPATPSPRSNGLLTLIIQTQ